MNWKSQRNAAPAQPSERRGWLRDALDWRGAHERGMAPSEPAPSARPFDPAHFMAVQAALTLPERALAQEVAAELSPEDRQTLMNQLGSMTVDEAVAFIRRTLASAGKASA